MPEVSQKHIQNGEHLMLEYILAQHVRGPCDVYASPRAVRNKHLTAMFRCGRQEALTARSASPSCVPAACGVSPMARPLSTARLTSPRTIPDLVIAVVLATAQPVVPANRCAISAFMA